jgi:hypothetical protein
MTQELANCERCGECISKGTIHDLTECFFELRRMINAQNGQIRDLQLDIATLANALGLARGS